MSAPLAEPYHSQDYELWIFGAKTCCVCGEVFAANTDYFSRDNDKPDGLTGACKNCRRARDRERYRQRPDVRARKVAADRERRQRMKEGRG